MESNPYADMALAELHYALMARAGGLTSGKPASRQDLAYLCIAAAWAIAPHESAPVKRQEMIRNGESLAAVLGAFHEQEARALRNRTLTMAVDALALHPQQAWPEPVRAAIHGAIESDDRLTVALRRLEEIRSDVSHS